MVQYIPLSIFSGVNGSNEKTIELIQLMSKMKLDFSFLTSATSCQSCLNHLFSLFK